MIFRPRLRTSIVSVLLAVGAAPLAAHASDGAHDGGTLKIVAASAAGTIDPHISYETGKYWPFFYITNDGLVTFKKTEGAASAEIVPDLAEAMPKVENAGKTYVFTLRKGIKFSTGKDVTPADVVASFQRLFKVSNPNSGSWYNVLVGADACLKTPASCSLEGGVVADDASGTVTFHLTQADSEFLYKLAVPFGSILPADTPATDLGNTPAISTGPYVIASYDPQTSMVIKRNPYFKEWSEAAQPRGYVDEIVYTFGVKPEDAVTAIENGQQDWMFDSAPADRLNEMSSKYSSQIHINPRFSLFGTELNVNIPPFNNKDARLALNYAVNRRSVINIVGGPKLAQPNCQLLPIGFPGYKPYCPYTKNPGTDWSAPDMAKAKELMEKSGQKGQKVTVIAGDGSSDPVIGTYLVSVLNELGFDATLKVISENIQWTYVQNSNNNVQITINIMNQDYPAPSDFLYVLFSCHNFNPGSDASPNVSGYCNKEIEDKMSHAMAKAINNPITAEEMWTEIDHRLTDDAPWVTLYSPKQLDFVSNNVKNFVYSYQSRVLFSRIYLN